MTCWPACGCRGRREELCALRTRAVCRLRRLLAELTPGGMRRALTAGKAEALPARIRPGDDVARIRLQLARGHLAGIGGLDARLKTAAAQVSDLVSAPGTTLASLFGVGAVTAGRILAETGDVARFAARDKFAGCNGTAPTGASSGDQVRRRLSRAGNRRTSRALPMMAVTQIRCPWTGGRRSCERKRAEGKTPKEALRCLKRRLSDQACRQLIRDAQGRIEACRSPTTRPPAPPASTSPANGSPAAAPASPPPRPKASGHSPSSTGKTTGSPASRSSMPAPASTRTSSRKPKSSAENGCPVPRAGAG